MLTSSLLKKKRGWSLISNDNSGLSYRPSDMGEQVSGEEKHPRGQTWAGSRVILEAAKGHGGRVAGRAQGLALRPPEPCQSRPRAGWQRAGGGWARLLQDRAPPEPPRCRLGAKKEAKSSGAKKEGLYLDSSQPWGIGASSDESCEIQNLRLGPGKHLTPSFLPFLSALVHGGDAFLVDIFIPGTVGFLQGRNQIVKKVILGAQQTYPGKGHCEGLPALTCSGY